MRRYREVTSQLISDLGGSPSEAQLIILRRAATLVIWSEGVEAKLANGQELQIAPYTTAANTLRRLLADLGLERRMKDVTPSLATYLAGRSKSA